MRLGRAYRAAMDLGCDCKNCPLSKPPHGEPVLPPRPKRTTKMIVLGEGPGPDEEAFKAYFVGASGDYLDEMCVHFNIPREHLHISNVTLCRPRRELSTKDWGKAIAACHKRLREELMKTRCRVILAFGGKAFQAITGILFTKARHYHGMPWPGVEPFDRFQVLPSYHPAHVIRPENGAFSPSVFEFTDRAWRLAHGKLRPARWPKIIIDPTEEAEDALADLLREKGPVGFDVETRGTDPLSSLCMCIGIAGEKVSVSVPWEEYTARKGELVPSILDSPRGRSVKKLCASVLRHCPLVLQNGPHDLLTAERLSLRCGTYAFDTLLAHAVIAQGMFHDLGYIAALETLLPRWKTLFHATTHEKGTDAFARRDPRELRTYNAKDAWVTLRLMEPLKQRLDDLGKPGWDVYNTYIEAMKIAMKMQRAGVRVDPSRFAQHREVLSRRKREAEKQVMTVADSFGITPLNLNSTPQMRHFFFGKMQVHPKYRSEKTDLPSLDERALTDMIVHPNDLVKVASRATLRYRKNKKLLEYLDRDRLTSDNLTHITWKPHGAKTMRWSSSPNLQNIPKPVRKKNKRTGEWRVVSPGLRDIFVAHTPGDWVVCADYDQLELRIIAMLAGDLPLLETFKNGDDPHAANAAGMFGYSNPREVGTDERDMAKVWIYQAAYGGTPEAIWKHVVVDFPNYTLKQSIQNRKDYFLQHPSIPRWHDTSLRQAQDERSIKAPLSGHILEFYSRVEANKVYNYPVQHTAADVINPTVPKVALALDWSREFLMGQIHDELVTCGPDPVRLAKKLTKLMTRRVTINNHTLTFSVGIKMGPSYGEVVELKKGETPEHGAKRIGQLYKERFRFLKRYARELKTDTKKGALARVA